MGIPVKLQVFEGPLDLLLHLIDKNKIDIYDIPIVEITNQYMEYIRAMEKEDLNVMSEFLLMAATLLDIKCRMLLPKEINEEGQEEDPRQELVEQLLQYKMYKYMAYELRDRQVEGERAIYREPDIPEEVQEYVEPVNLEELLGDLTLAKLNRIFRDVMRRQDEKIDPIRSGFGKIEKEEVSLPECGGIRSKPLCIQFPAAFEKAGIESAACGDISCCIGTDEDRKNQNRTETAF